MSKHQVTLEMEVTEDDAAAACRAALRDLGWRSTAEDGALLGEEDPAHLHCHSWPASARLQIQAPEEGRSTRVAIQVTVPGAGPISSRHASERSRALARAIVARAGV